MSIPAGGLFFAPPGGALDLEDAITETAEKIQSAMESDGRTRPEDMYVTAAELVWGHLYGQLRGRVPVPIPFDLASVAVAAGMRIAKGYVDVGSIFLNQGQYQAQAEFRPWSGFLLPELLIIWRYRRRTA